MKKLNIFVVLLILFSATTAFAVSPVVKPYTFTDGTKAEAAKVNSDFDTVYTGTNNAIGAINAAAGTKATLAGRLAVGINDDGTLKTTVTAGGQWLNPDLSPAYVSGTQFTVSGDHTDIYVQYRRIKATLAGGAAYSEVSASSYSAGTGLTTVTLAGSILTSPITSIEHSLLTPVASNNSAISANMIGTVNSATSASNATTVGGFTPSQTPGANRAAVADSGGKLANGWLNASATPGANQLPILSASSVLALPNAVHTINGNTIWHAGNDGAGSGLDSDLLDGKHNGEVDAATLATRKLFSGYVNAGGTPITGSGYTVTKLGTGQYQINLTGYNLMQSAVASISGIGQFTVRVITLASSYFTLNTYDSGNTLTDYAFTFVAY